MWSFFEIWKAVPYKVSKFVFRWRLTCGVIFSLLWRHYQTPNQNIKWKIYLINKCMKYFVRSISMWMSYAGLIARRNKVFQQETFFERKQIHIFLWNCSHFHTSKMELFEKTVHDLSKMELFEKTVHDF